MTMRQGERMKLCIEQDREEQEKRRSGMPGSISQGNGWWRRKRTDVYDAMHARQNSPELD